jgi:hypothetical protein
VGGAIRGSICELVDGGGQHCYVEGGVRGHGRRSRVRQRATEGENGSDACHEEDGRGGGDKTTMKPGTVASQAVEIKVVQPE